MSKKTNQEKQARRQARTVRAHKKRKGRRPNVLYPDFHLTPEQLAGMAPLDAGSVPKFATDVIYRLMIDQAARKLGYAEALTLLTMAQLVKDGIADTKAPEFESIPRPDEPVQ